jgi:hypothetical protein
MTISTSNTVRELLDSQNSTSGVLPRFGERLKGDLEWSGVEERNLRLPHSKVFPEHLSDSLLLNGS